RRSDTKRSRVMKRRWPGSAPTSAKRSSRGWSSGRATSRSRPDTGRQARTPRAWRCRVRSCVLPRRWTLRPEAARAFERLAASIADGASVDWDTNDVQLSGVEQRLVRHLRLIDSLATVYRTLPPEAEDLPDPE